MRQTEKTVVRLLDEVLFNKFPVNFVNLVLVLSGMAVAFIAGAIVLVIFLLTLI